MKHENIPGILLDSWVSSRPFACVDLSALTGLHTCSGKTEEDPNLSPLAYLKVLHKEKVKAEL